MDTPTLYTQTGCADSAKVRAWLTERALYANGVFATPLLVVGDAKLLGFRPPALAALLAKALERGA